MTAPDGSIPSGGLSSTGIAAYANKTQTDWQNENHTNMAGHWAGGVTGFLGILTDIGSVISGLANLVGNLISNAASVIGNIAGVVVDTIGSTLQNIWDFIVGGIQGLGSFFFGGSTGNDVQTVTQNLAANVAAMQSGIAALQTAAANGNFSGTAAFIDFSTRANASSLGADFTQTYFGSGTATLGITGGLGAWGGTWGTSPRTGYAVYNAAQTQTDYQRIGIAFASTPNSNGGSNPACNYIGGRVNAAGTEYVFVELFPTTCKIGCVVSGVTTYFATSTLYGGFKAGAAYFLECGTTGGSNIFRVYENSRIILTYTDAGAVSKVGASYRYTAMASYYFANGSYHTTPGNMAAMSMADNTPKPTLGSGFRRYRASGSTVGQSSGSNLIASNFFDTADLITDDLTYTGGSNNQVTVSVAGWYLIKGKIKLSGNPLGGGGDVAQILLYVNGTAVQADVQSWGTGPTNWGGCADLGGMFIQYLNVGDYVQLGIYSTTSMSLIGGSSGSQSHYEVVFLNNTKPKN